jgi:hypothetical protein
MSIGELIDMVGSVKLVKMDPKPWREAYDDTSGRVCMLFISNSISPKLCLDYYNKETKERKWAKEMDPDLIQLIQKEALRKAEAKTLAKATDTPSASDPPSPYVEEAPLPAGWKEAKDEDSGRIYYYNKKTKQTSWDRPLS